MIGIRFFKELYTLQSSDKTVNYHIWGAIIFFQIEGAMKKLGVTEFFHEK